MECGQTARRSSSRSRLSLGVSHPLSLCRPTRLGSRSPPDPRCADLRTARAVDYSPRQRTQTSRDPAGEGKLATRSMRISPIASISPNAGASGQFSGEMPSRPGAAFLMGISSSASAALWLSAAFGRLLRSLVRPQSFLPLSALMIYATRLPKLCLILRPMDWIALRCRFLPSNNC